MHISARNIQEPHSTIFFLPSPLLVFAKQSILKPHTQISVGFLFFPSSGYWLLTFAPTFRAAVSSVWDSACFWHRSPWDIIKYYTRCFIPGEALEPWSSAWWLWHTLSLASLDGTINLKSWHALPGTCLQASDIEKKIAKDRSAGGKGGRVEAVDKISTFLILPGSKTVALLKKGPGH